MDGGDVAGALAAGLTPNEPGMRALRDKVEREAAIPADAPAETAIELTYRALATAPSRVILATLDDALAVVERPNMPGTTDRLAQTGRSRSVPLEKLEEHELPRRIAQAMKRSGRRRHAHGPSAGQPFCARRRAPEAGPLRQSIGAGGFCGRSRWCRR